MAHNLSNNYLKGDNNSFEPLKDYQKTQGTKGDIGPLHVWLSTSKRTPYLCDSLSVNKWRKLITVSANRGEE